VNAQLMAVYRRTQSQVCSLAYELYSVNSRIWLRAIDDETMNIVFSIIIIIIINPNAILAGF